MKKGRRLPILLFVSCVCPAYAGSDEQFRHFLSLSLEELMAQNVTISTQSEQTVSEAPSVVSVVTADDIKATGATNLAEVLQAVPGVNVRYQHFGLRPLITFRGANNKQTLLMVNGAPMSDLMWRLGIFWKGLPASIIERVEVIRGPGSALFGTDASAGVINVITKTAGRMRGTEAGLRVGSFNTHSAWIEHGSTWNGYDIGLTVDLQRTDSHDPFVRVDAQTGNDLDEGTNASLAPGDAEYAWNNADLRLSVARGDWRLHLDYTVHDDLETGMTGAGAIDPVTEGEDTRFHADLFYANKDFLPNWGAKGELRYRHIDYSSGDGFQEWPAGYDDGTGVYPDGAINRMRSAEHKVSGELSGTYRGVDDHAITVGGGFYWQDIYRVEQQVNFGVDASGTTIPPGSPLVDLSDSPHAFAPEKSRTVGYFYLQDVWKINDSLELTAGARYDHFSDFGDSVNPRLALVWQTSDRLTTKLLYGSAFRAPYFLELFTETSFSLPNSGLDPETSETWEVSFDYRPSKTLRLEVNLFHFEQQDVIVRQVVAGLPKKQFQNSGEHDIQGLEFEASWQAADDLIFAANYAFNDPDDSPHRDFGTPQHQAHARADWQFDPNWNWNIQGNWIGDVERPPGDARPDVDDFLLVDTTLRYVGIRDWEFTVSVRNLLDEEARAYTSSAIPDDLELPGRSVFFEARYDLDSLAK